MKTKHFAYILLAALMVPALAFGQLGSGSQTVGPLSSGTYTSTFALVPGDATAAGPGGIAGFLFTVQLADPNEISQLTVSTVGAGAGGLFGPGTLNATTTQVGGSIWIPQALATLSGGSSALLSLQYILQNTNADDVGVADIDIWGTPIVHLSTGIPVPQGSTINRYVSYGNTSITGVTNVGGGPIGLLASNYLPGGSATAQIDVSHPPSDIPEPATMTMLGGGLAFLFAGVAFRRRRRKEEV